MENFGIFYGHFGIFKAILVFLRPCGVFLTIWYILWYILLVCTFFQFWYVAPRKIWQPWLNYVQSFKCRPILDE
jgi:hypothetical protein